ncbi:MAG TPA: D-alanine--D-alanine ligase [Candidatus Eisenbacteria bacterium]|nr:D-alanine--D-alanine ligase [Candidatus Eisenbacteria bacterium]
MKVAVLMGGRSSEREISLRTGRGVAQALRNLGHDVTSVDAADGRVLPAGDEEAGAPKAAAVRALPLSAMLEAVQSPAVRGADVVFLALHGTYGEDGTIQAALELAGKVYTGSGVLASAVAMDKAMSKRVFEREAIPTPHWVLLEAGVPGSAIDVSLLGGWPLVVKPNAEGSTVGLTIVHKPGQLDAALHKAAEFDHQVLVEEYIGGRELTVTVAGEEAYPVVEIKPKSGFYDYESKYTKGRTEYLCPAPLDKEMGRHVRELSVESAQVLGCRGVVRVDLRLNDDDEPYVLEVNTIPGMTPTSLVPMAAQAKGVSYDQLVGRMLDLAVADARLRRADQRQGV